MSALEKALQEAKVIVTVGSGGVGKTTSAAAIAIAAARRGRRAAVLTIDPAKRLAQALGLEKMGNEPRPIAEDLVKPGAVDAMMLETGNAFDDLIGRLVPDPEREGVRHAGANEVGAFAVRWFRPARDRPTVLRPQVRRSRIHAPPWPCSIASRRRKATTRRPRQPRSRRPRRARAERARRQAGRAAAGRTSAARTAGSCAAAATPRTGCRSRRRRR